MAFGAYVSEHMNVSKAYSRHVFQPSVSLVLTLLQAVRGTWVPSFHAIYGQRQWEGYKPLSVYFLLSQLPLYH